MCFVTGITAAGVSAALGGLGAATSAYGIYEGGQASKNASIYQAAVAHNNELIAGTNAERAIAAGNAQAHAVSLKGAATGGKIKTAQAASGIDVNTGSAVDVQEGQREQEKLDAETVMSNAQLQAYGYRTQAQNFAAESDLTTMKGEQAEIGADIGAFGSLLSNASSLGAKWGSFGGDAGNFGGSPETNPNLRPLL